MIECETAAQCQQLAQASSNLMGAVATAAIVGLVVLTAATLYQEMRRHND